MGTGPANPDSWNFVNGVESFQNPAGGSAQVSIFPVPWVSASASSVAPTGPGPTTGYGSDENSTGSDVALEYDIQVDGPLSRTPITVFWNGTYILAGATDPDGVTYVDATVGSSPGFLASCAVLAGCAAGISGAFTGTSLVLPTGNLHVDIAAAASSENGEEAGFAYIDPYFYLSPAEIAAGDTLAFSASIGNAPTTVPSPATGGLLLTGLGLLTIASLRRNPSLRASRS
jgi:hypothetical protein